MMKSVMAGIAKKIHIHTDTFFKVTNYVVTALGKAVLPNNFTCLSSNTSNILNALGLKENFFMMSFLRQKV